MAKEYHDPFDDLFEQMFRSFRPFVSMHTIGTDRKGGEITQHRRPVTDMFETEKEIVATFELPGVEKGDIKLNVEENVLEVKVDKAKEEKSADEYRSTNVSFYRSLTLPSHVKANQVKATYNNGVLEVRIPKVKEVRMKGKAIKIE